MHHSETVSVKVGKRGNNFTVITWSDELAIGEWFAQRHILPLFSVNYFGILVMKHFIDKFGDKTEFREK